MAGFTREDFEDVYSTARMAHMGQKRRSGGEYFTHPSEVRNIVRRYYPNDHAAQMVALLHDSLEDAPGSTVDSVEEMESFIRGSIGDPSSGQEVIDAVRSLTHDSGDYGSYVVSLLDNPLALRVKLSDMLHNLSTSPSDRQKKKYEDALTTVSDAAGGIPNAIGTEHWDDLTSLVETTGIRMLRLLVRECMTTPTRFIRKGDTVRCRDTGRLGIVIEHPQRGADSMWVNVLWSDNKTTLTETFELELIIQ